MGSLAEWAGGSREVEFGANLRLGSRGGRVRTLTPTTAGLEVFLPDARRLMRGGWVRVIVNAGSDSFDVVDHDGGAVATLAQDDVAILALVDNSTAAGDWRARVRSSTSILDPLTNKKVYTLLQDAWKYDPELNSWTAGATGPVVTVDSASAVVLERAYVFGRNDETTEYDPDVWTAKATSTTSGAERCAAAQSNLVEVYGRGTNNLAHEQYDRAADSWTARTDLPGSTSRAQAQAADDGRIYVYGGSSNPTFGSVHNAITTNREHDPTPDSFTTRASLPTSARTRHGGFAMDGHPFALCGDSDGSGSGTDIDRLDEYDPDLDAWTVRQVWPHGANDDGPGASSRGTQAFATGGSTGKESASYQIDTWSTTMADHGAAGSTYPGIHRLTATIA